MYHLKTYPSQEFLLSPSKSSGPYIFDKTGYKYLDLTAGGTSFNLLGSGLAEVNEAIMHQLSRYSHLDCKSFDDDNRELLSELVLTGNKLDLRNTHQVFFSGGSGAESIEMAMHLSYQLHVEAGKANKRWFLSRNQSYHGSTSGALSLGERPNLEFYRPLHSALRARVSECNYQKNSYPDESIDDYTNRLLEEFEHCILDIGPDNICGFVSETMMGGLVGDVPPTPRYWHGISQLCEKYNIHLILDEVWCGTGTSGKYHCFEYDDIVPDFLCLGKSLGCGYVPISAVLVPRQLEEVIKNGSGRIEMSCTFQAHSVAVASALAVQSIILSDNFISDVFNKGKYIRNCLSQAIGSHSFVKDIRGRGVRNSIEYNCDYLPEFSQAIGSKLFAEHRIISSSKWHRTSFCHAMNLSFDDINLYLDAYLSVFKDLSATWPNDKYISSIKRHNY